MWIVGGILALCRNTISVIVRKSNRSRPDSRIRLEKGSFSPFQTKDLTASVSTSLFISNEIYYNNVIQQVLSTLNRVSTARVPVPARFSGKQDTHETLGALVSIMLGDYMVEKHSSRWDLLKRPRSKRMHDRNE
jgi:hypothetical protein